MAITTYAELQTAVASWAHRSDDEFTDAIPEMITLAEARLYDLLLLKDMETETTLTAVVSQNYVALPSDYLSPIALWIVIDSVRVQMLAALPQELPYDVNDTQPRMWAIDGANIRFDCPADDTYSLPFRYVANSALSSSNTSNYLLTRKPDLYLAASLVEAARWAQDADLMNAWEPRFVDGVKSIKAAENRARGMVPLRTDLPIRRRSNILTGE